jgi:RNA polymerase sigma-70 factor (ECF subfamily)
MDTKPERFLELMVPLKSPLLAYIKHLLWNKNDLEDALQNVLAEAYNKFGQFTAGTNFKSWVFQIAAFTIFNMNRKYHKETNTRKSISPDIDLPAPEYASSPEYKGLLAGNDRILEKISDEMKLSLSVLNEQERSVFLLRSLAEFNYEEIARTLQMPVGSVMSNLSRSRAKLRSELAGYLKEGGAI